MSTNAKIAIITGGSRGLGKSMALHLAKQGTDVIFTYNSNKTEADNVVTEVEKMGRRVKALQLNVGEVKTFDSFATKVKEVLTEWNTSHFNFLINNAGIGMYIPFMNCTEENFDTMVNIHFKGVFFLTQKLVPLMADHGRIINISSGLTRFTMVGSSIYASMKGAIETLTKYLATELSPRKISVNVVAPGAIATDFGGGMVRDNKEVNAMIASHTALGRVGLADDIGGVVASLLAPETAWINAERIEVSGGANFV